MAINNPIIAGAATVTRAEVKTVVVASTSTIPPATALRVVDGVLTPVDQSPEREGQMIVHVDASDPSNRIASMYVVVLLDVAGAIEPTWKIVSNWGIVLDPRTGLPKNPRLEFYSIFA